MPTIAASGATLSELDDATRALIRLAAKLAAGSEDEVRVELQAAALNTPQRWIEEILLQTYLFAGFPRALNGMREWRRIARPETPRGLTEENSGARDYRERGEQTCALVYGRMYDRLRRNIRQLHPALDDWMIEEGYGKVLGRPGLDLGRRELCIVAACAAMGQDRQLHSHLHGARNVGVPDAVVRQALDALETVIGSDLLARARDLWRRVSQLQ